jgi:FkbM family methyltransferase
MKRPLLLQLIPERYRSSAFFRLYSGKNPGKSLELYENAPLSYAPKVSLKLVPGDHISNQIAFTGFYELALTRRVASLAKEGGTIDIGANLGYFSCLWAAGNIRNKCFAFEASPRISETLEINIKKNNFDSQITLFPVAAGYESGTLTFDIGPKEQTGWGGFSNEFNSNCIQVDVVRVDQVVPNNLVIDLLKVDIEGGDAWALKGCESLLKQRIIKEVWFEQNKRLFRICG